MEPEADDLMVEGMKKNYIDLDQYPQTAEIHNRCVQILANLYHAPLKEGEQATGTGCVGSSEAIMLAGLAMKRKWRDRRIAAGLSYDKPNIICGSNVQVCWHKMCKYFDIECREGKERKRVCAVQLMAGWSHWFLLLIVDYCVRGCCSGCLAGLFGIDC